MSQIDFEKAANDFGIDVNKMARLAPFSAGTTVNSPNAGPNIDGTVFQMPRIPDLTAAPTMEDFNNLLLKMRQAGIMFNGTQGNTDD